MTDNPLAALRALKGAPISCVIAMQLAGRPVGAGWLAAATGYAHFAITNALRVLFELRIAVKVNRYNAWILTERGRQLLPPVGGGSALLEQPVPGSGSSSIEPGSLKLRQPPEPSAHSMHSTVPDCRGKPCERRRDLLVNLAIGYLEQELHAADPKFAQGERRDPHAITYESIEAEVNALIDEGNGDATGLLVYRIRQLANGERRSRLTRHAFERLTEKSA